jgi:hypothetical protein
MEDMGGLKDSEHNVPNFLIFESESNFSFPLPDLFLENVTIVLVPDLWISKQLPCTDLVNYRSFRYDARMKQAGKDTNALLEFCTRAATYRYLFLWGSGQISTTAGVARTIEPEWTLDAWY